MTHGHVAIGALTDCNVIPSFAGRRIDLGLRQNLPGNARRPATKGEAFLRARRASALVGRARGHVHRPVVDDGLRTVTTLIQGRKTAPLVGAEVKCLDFVIGSPAVALASDHEQLVVEHAYRSCSTRSR